MDRKIALVFGMHKSGLSVIGEMLKAFEFDFLGSDEICKLNSDILKHFNLAWSSVESITPQNLLTLPEEYAQRALMTLNLALAVSPRIAFKDPQFCRLMPFWSNILSMVNLPVYCFIASRHPFAIASSLYQSNNFDGEHTFALWRAHMLESSSFMHPGWKRLVLDYDRILNDPVADLGRMSEILELTTSFSKIRDCVSLVNRSARHAFVNYEVKLQAHPDHQILWDSLYRLSKGEVLPTSA